MRKTLAAVTIAGAAVLGMSIAAPALATTASYSTATATAKMNNPASWGTDCKKIEFKDGVKTYTLPTNFYSVVVVKAGTQNTIYEAFEGGTVKAANGKAISHLISCVGTPTDEPSGGSYAS